MTIENHLSTDVDYVKANYQNIFDRGFIFESEGQYYAFMGLGEAIDRLTNFVIYPIAKIETEEGATYKALFVNVLAEERELSFSPECLTSPAMFKRMLSEKTMGFCYFGNGKVMPLLQEYFSGLDWKTVIGVKAAGIHFLGGRPVYVAGEKAISYDNSPVCDLVQENDSCVIKSNILNCGYIAEEDLNPIGNALMSFNDPLRTVSVLAWCAACFIKQHLKEAAIKFPSLLLIGEAGSGKSTTLDHIIEPMFSCEDAASASGITEAALKKKIASSNMIPMLIEEFKPGKMEKSQVNAICNYLRNVYDGNASEKIMGSSKVKSFIPTAPVVLVGEQDVDEPAIRERSIKVLFSKRGLKNHTDAFKTISENAEKISQFGRSLLETALRTDIDTVKAWYFEGIKKYNDALAARIRSSLACCYAGLKLIERLLEYYDMEWDDVFPIGFDDCVSYLESAAVKYLLGGRLNNKNVIEETFEVMARMGLEKGVDYRLSRDNSFLFIRIHDIYDKVTQYCKEKRIVGDLLSHHQFCQQLDCMEICLDSNKTQSFKCGSKRCYMIDYALLKDLCNVDGFLN